MEHFTAGLPLLEGGAEETEESYADEDSDIVVQIKSDVCRILKNLINMS